MPFKLRHGMSRLASSQVLLTIFSAETSMSIHMSEPRLKGTQQKPTVRQKKGHIGTAELILERVYLPSHACQASKFKRIQVENPTLYCRQHSAQNITSMSHIILIDSIPMPLPTFERGIKGHKLATYSSPYESVYVFLIRKCITHRR